jgi:transcriptional regulator with XRE-family HTH domain
MFSWDGPQPDRKSDISLRVGRDESNVIDGLSNVPCTIREVASLAGVSIATVSRVTSGSNNVSRKTAAKVLAAVSQLQYQPNVLAAELARGRGGSLGMRSAPLPETAGKQAARFSYSGTPVRDKRGRIG